jgi:hypothetical protein
VYVLHPVFGSCCRFLDETCSQCGCLRPRVQAIFLVPAASFLLSLCRSGSFLSQEFFFVHLLIFWFCVNFSWAGFLLPRAPIRFAAENFFRCPWSQHLERSSVARFSSSSPTNLLSLPWALSAADLAAQFARLSLFFGFLGFNQFSCVGN